MTTADRNLSSYDGLARIDRARKTRGGTLTLLVGTIVAVNLGLVILGQGAKDPVQYTFASMILWICMIPIILYGIGPRRSTPVFPLICFAYFVYYGYPIFITNVMIIHDDVVRPAAITTALEYATLGAASLVGGFYLGRFDKLAVARARVELEFKPAASRLAAIALIGTVMHVFSSTVGEFFAGQIYRVLESIALVSLVSLFSAWLRGEATTLHKVQFVLCMSVWILRDLGSGTLAAVMLDVALLVLVYVRVAGRVPWFSIVAAAIVVTPFLQTKHAFRAETWKEDVTRGPLESGTYFISMTYDQMSNGSVTTESATKTAESRFNHIITVAYVTEMTPAVIPFQHGDSYMGIFWTLVPRILYPDKPTKTLGNDFGRQYGLLDENDKQTSYNFEQLTESYVNFGVEGVFIFHILSGLFYRLFAVIFDREDSGEGGKLIFVVFGLMMLNIESDFSLVFGAMPYFAVALFAFMRFISGAPRNLAKTDSPPLVPLGA